ncbi:MAG: hypothetical protein AAF514_04980, partial [Verrucomicrobiota bacterium]
GDPELVDRLTRKRKAILSMGAPVEDRLDLLPFGSSWEFTSTYQNGSAWRKANFRDGYWKTGSLGAELPGLEARTVFYRNKRVFLNPSAPAVRNLLFSIRGPGLARVYLDSQLVVDEITNPPPDTGEDRNHTVVDPSLKTGQRHVLAVEFQSKDRMDSRPFDLSLQANVPEKIDLFSTKGAGRLETILTNHQDFVPAQLLQREQLPFIGREAAMEKDPGEAAGWERRARYFLRQGNPPEALASIERALQIQSATSPDRIHPLLVTFSQVLSASGKKEEAQSTFLKGAGIEDRAPGTPDPQIDLTQHYNGRLGEPWLGGPAGLGQLPTGSVNLPDAGFDIRGIIQLSSHGLKKETPGSYPDTYDAIPLNRSGKTLHFLHACTLSRGVDWGTEVGHYKVRYDSGEEIRIPLRLGIEVADWQFTEEAATRLQSKESTNERNSGVNPIAWHSPDSTTSLYHLAWANPRPDDRLHSITFHSGPTRAAPLLVALTVLN